ncbi:hypothetical protein NWP96_01755 [Mycoplasmopsis cynos]|nr:hypothetical protein [Mycoplasmopsis cynos]
MSLINISPLSSGNNPAIIFDSVLLPEPLIPRILDLSSNINRSISMA